MCQLVLVLPHSTHSSSGTRIMQLYLHHCTCAGIPEINLKTIFSNTQHFAVYVPSHRFQRLNAPLVVVTAGCNVQNFLILLLSKFEVFDLSILKIHPMDSMFSVLLWYSTFQHTYIAVTWPSLLAYTLLMNLDTSCLPLWPIMYLYII